MAINTTLAALSEVGQSIWYDNLSRDVLLSGELKSLIEQGVLGLTSNPTIFKNAIADSALYDEELIGWAKSGLNTEQICEELMVEDVRRASDLLRPVYDGSNGADGYASIEVSPYLARDAAGTVEAAVRLWNKLSRPNIMIKIPGTVECIPAIGETLEKGINVNVTLLFSEKHYLKVAESYIAALAARAQRNEDIRSIASVASFFVSRVDAICEKTFDAAVKDGKVKEESRSVFFGKVGIANSKVAYAAYEKLFGAERFAKLRTAGARVQRPLWASTGTKNPAFSPVMYVEALAGRDTVNTLPPATLKALLKGADVGPKLHTGMAEAAGLIAQLKNVALDFDALMDQLQLDGVKLFADSYRDLLESIEKKRAALKV